MVIVILTTFEQCTNVFFFFFNEWTAIKIYIYIYILFIFYEWYKKLLHRKFNLRKSSHTFLTGIQISKEM